jgi:hypothetical protein
MREMMQSD